MDGQTVLVSIKAEDMDETQKLKENSVITVKYGGINAYNKLIQPVFMRNRHDVSWSDVLEQQNKNN